MKTPLALLATAFAATALAADAPPAANADRLTATTDAAAARDAAERRAKRELEERQTSERLAAEYLAMRQADTAYDLPKIFAGKLVNAEGQPVDSALLAKAKYRVLYFSSYSCGPCHRFTPLLVKFLQEHDKAGEVAVVLVSSDRTDAAMFTYMKKFAMPWPAMRPARIRDPKAADDLGGLKTGIEYIPHLRVFDASGKMVFDTFDAAGKRRDNGPLDVLDDLKAALAGKPAAPAAPAPLPPTPAK